DPVSVTNANGGPVVARASPRRSDPAARQGPVSRTLRVRPRSVSGRCPEPIKDDLDHHRRQRCIAEEARAIEPRVKRRQSQSLGGDAQRADLIGTAQQSSELHGTEAGRSQAGEPGRDAEVVERHNPEATPDRVTGKLSWSAQAQP